MPPEVIETHEQTAAPAQAEQQPQETAEQGQDAFEAGFAQARGEEPPAPKSETEEKAEEQQPEEKAPEAKAEEPPLIAGLTETQLRDLLAKANRVDTIEQETNTRLRQAFGKLGEINSLVQQLQQTRGNAVSVKGLKRLSEEFPEMAKMLEEDLNEALTGAGAAPAFDQSKIDDLVSTRLTEVEDKVTKEMEKRWLSRQHKDWKEQVASADFNLWKDNVLPKEEAAVLDESWDADFVAEKLTEFKAWKDRKSVV